MSTDMRFPIGPFLHEGAIDSTQRDAWISDIEELPEKLATALIGLNDDQLDTPYRDGGWTVRQVAHHLADSHMNSFIRFKLALTEEHPSIKPYFEEKWALLEDTVKAPLALSLELLRGLHGRWALLLRSLTEDDFSRTFFHPGSQTIVPLSEALGTYSWHGKHHVAHITKLREKMGW
ncbi:YfiT family bacillithiol transferase [Cohnella faecalis]|uniref:Putative metal-dependent hydrolase D3H35_05000 n=1 Tax=Cohnella faecalis TaxID=2315694 RepID=A0A398CYD8_9BACL|nr:bacillithiol transferase BstA [Cohnella faecalis]RIE04827.1 putative metal-dependent hydrolase [Cohnella faecalis]